jgi:hypothetical protein
MGGLTMGLYQLKPSFAGGELSDSMYGRVDINKYDSGAATLKNFTVQRYGGVRNRNGFRHIGVTYGGKRAFYIPFLYNANETYIIEVTAGHCRFLYNGQYIVEDNGEPYTISNNLNAADLQDICKIKYTQSADVLFIVHPDHYPMTLTRYSTYDWRWEQMPITGGPFEDSNGSAATEEEQITQVYRYGAGTYELTLPDTVTNISVELAGAGGGGSGVASSLEQFISPGGDGGVGELIKFTTTVVAGKKYTLSVGTGGAGGNGAVSNNYFTQNTSQAGGNGGESVAFGKTARGGQGGGSAVQNGSKGHAGSNGTGYIGGGSGGTKGTDRANPNGKSGGDGFCNIRFRYGSKAAKLTASAIEGEVTLTANKDIFEKDNIGSLIELTHYKKSEYKKGVPDTTDALLVSCLPGSSVYVESFGFWKGNFSLEKYNENSSMWELVRTQDGNHSQNYNFTEKNEEEYIVRYRVTSTEFDTTIWSGENEKQTGYVTLQSFGNDYSGIIKITEYISGKKVKGKVLRTIGSTDATQIWAFSPWSRSKGYPTAAGFFEDRLVFAGSTRYPQTFWSSKVGDYYNFGTSTPVVDDDAVTATLNGGQMNGIKAMVAFGELILLTSGGEYKVSGGQGKALTPSNTLSQAQEYRGISDVLPVTVGSRIVFAQQQGNIIRDLAYSYEADKYTGDDLNLLCSHLFDGHKVVAMTYQQTPDSIIWFVRDDGLLLGLTYIKEQDIYAWHKHSIKNARFVNVCCIPGGECDELYAVIERNGQYENVMLEKRNDNDVPEEQIYVDDGITVRGSDIKEVTGLTWLEGETVAILADGNALPQQKVEGGKVTLSEKHGYSVVHVGLPIDAVIKTLPIEFQMQDGSSISRKKRIGNLSVLFKNTRGGLYGLSEEKLDEIKWRDTEAYGQPTKLFTGKKKIVLPAAGWDETQQLIIKQDAPLPMTVLAIVPEIVPGG